MILKDSNVCNFEFQLGYAMYRTVIFILLLSMSQTGMAQSSRFGFFFGYGYYEGVTAGGEIYNKCGSQSLSLSAGYFRRFQKEEETFSITTGYQHAILLKQCIDANTYKWHVGLRAVFWRHEDPWYLWKAASIIPSVNLNILVFNKIKLNLDAGPAFNIVLYNKRKTFEQAGWPYHVMPEFKMVFIF
jgi:hypothetical protein